MGCDNWYGGNWDNPAACGANQAGDWVGEDCGFFNTLPPGDPECLEPITATGCASEDPCAADYPQIGDPCCDSACTLDINDFSCQFIECRTITSSLRGASQIGLTDATCNGGSNGDEVFHDGYQFLMASYSDPELGRASTQFMGENTTWNTLLIEGYNYDNVDHAFYWDDEDPEEALVWDDFTVEHLSHDGSLLGTSTVRTPLLRRQIRYLGTSQSDMALAADVRNQGTGAPVIYLIFRTINDVSNDSQTEQSCKLRFTAAVVTDQVRPLQWVDMTINLNGASDPVNDNLAGIIAVEGGDSFFLLARTHGQTYADKWYRFTASSSGAGNLVLDCVDYGTIANFTLTKNNLTRQGTSSNPIITAPIAASANHREMWKTTSQQSDTMYTIDDANVLRIQCANIAAGFAADCTDAPCRQYTIEMPAPHPIDGGLLTRVHSSLHLRQKDVLA